MNASWQILILLHAFFSAMQALQLRAIARDKKSKHAGLAVNAIAFSALYVCGLLVLPLIGDVDTKDFLRNWTEYTATAALFVLAIYLMYKAMTHLESATVSVLGTTSALFAVIFAGIFFGEKLSGIQFVGVAILLPCIWYVLYLARKQRKMFDFRDISWQHGFMYAMVSSICLGMAHILEKDILISSSLGTYIAFGWMMQAVIAWVFYFAFGRRGKDVFKRHKSVRSSLQLGVVRAATGLFFLMALVASNSVSLVTVVANFRIILVAVLAGVILGERKFYYKKMAAAAVSVIGLSIIFWN